MSDFTFLTEEQCFGDKQLDIFKKRGTKAAITDFSILLGVDVSMYYLWFLSSSDKEADYWLKADVEGGYAPKVGYDGWGAKRFG